MGFMITSAALPAVVTSLTFTTIAFLLVVTRIYTRVVVLKNAGTDDWIMVAAMAASIGFCIVVFYQIRYGLGQPFKTLPVDELAKFFQCLWATIPMYNLSLVLTKISIIFQYRRIFTTPKIRKLCTIMTVVLIIYGCWTVLGSTFMCIPVSYFWNTEIKGHCMNKLAFWFSNAALNITTDIIIFAIPMPLLKQLQLPKKQKIGLMFVFGFGAFVCVTSVIRLKSVYEISVATDTSLQGVNAAIWSGIEINVAISSASLPALKPLISKIVPRLFSSFSSRSRPSANGLSEDQLGSHELGGLKNESRRSKQAVEIKVEHDVYQAREVRTSLEGSDGSLVNWNANCFSEEQRRKQHEAV